MRKNHKQTEWFVRALAEGDSFLETDVMIHLSRQLDLTIGDHPFFCMVVRYVNRKQYLSDIAMIKLLYDACCHFCKTFSKNAYCYIGSQLYVVLIIPDLDNKYTIISKAKEQIEKYCKSPVQIGIGRTYQEIDKLNYSRIEAYEVLANIDESSSISFIDDFYTTQYITTQKLEHEKRKVIEQFKTGNLNAVMDNMEQLVEKVRRETPIRESLPYPTSIRRTVIELLVEIMHISADTGVDVEEVLDHQDPYRRVFELKTTPDILACFSDIIQTLYSSIQEINSKAESNMLALAKKCINSHIHNPELCLSLVSKELGITPTYFSSFFIREMEVGFNEYITNIRIEHAKELLSSTNMKIHAVATECGFRSASYFTAVFRKQTGISPGEYRSASTSSG